MIKTHVRYTIEQHRKGCHKINGSIFRNHSVCEGCLLIKEKPDPVIPGRMRRYCDIDVLKEVENNED